MKQNEETATISVEQAAKRLGVGRNQAYEAVKSGELPSLKIGRRILVPKAALEKLLETGRAA
ncbi:MAG TPA: helix-turn-helix domain-containing protein [Rhizomicrobium sp.]|jgi:excisionase family DNA binding protein|nr:helix-turn-helix domain-containing protein [Rhizomicrobium sp.]